MLIEIIIELTRSIPRGSTSLADVSLFMLSRNGTIVLDDYVNYEVVLADYDLEPETKGERKKGKYEF